MGAVEEGGKVATSVIESLKSQPLILALVVFNCLFMGAVFWGTKAAREDFTKTIQLMIEKQDKVSQMLYNCVPSGNKIIAPGSLPLELLNNPYIDPNPKK